MQEIVGGFQVLRSLIEDGGNPFYVWGQDRMWLLKEEIFKRIGG